MRSKLSNRISIYYISATAILILMIYVLIFFIIRSSLYTNADYKLLVETDKHLKEYKIDEEGIHYGHDTEWLESEHMEVRVYPIFVQIFDLEGNILDSSPNLRNARLEFRKNVEEDLISTIELNGEMIRQIQSPYKKNGKILAYLTTAISFEESYFLIEKLFSVLLISYPIILLILFLTSKYLSSRSIRPVLDLIDDTSKISRHNLDQRVILPKKKDELYSLAESINGLLDRIQEVVEREKQFTSDASHELRTPVSVLKGSFEVLLRHDRDTQEYKEKISSSLEEINRMSLMIDQLLILARIDKSHFKEDANEVDLLDPINNILSQLNSFILQKNIKINMEINEPVSLIIHKYYLELALKNILSNAIKYSPENSVVSINIQKDNDLIISIKDNGPGVPEDEIKKIFEPFYRSITIDKDHIKGTGLGLAIVSKVSELLDISIDLEISNGSNFIMVIPSNRVLK